MRNLKERYKKCVKPYNTHIKTITWFGEAGKYIPDSLRDAFRIYMAIPRRHWPLQSEDSFWIGGFPKMAQSLGDFCTLVGCAWQPTPTVLRKLFVTTVGELVSERAAGLLCVLL